MALVILCKRSTNLITSIKIGDQHIHAMGSSRLNYMTLWYITLISGGAGYKE